MASVEEVKDSAKALVTCAVKLSTADKRATITGISNKHRVSKSCGG